jgi:hypothetical protein
VKTLIVLLFLAPGLSFAVQESTAQGSFQNLGFESGTLVPIPGDSFNRVYFDQAFPGWRGYVGGIQETAAFHNADFLCCSAIAVWGDGPQPAPALEGSFSAYLHAAIGPDFQPADTSLAQTGLVPADARSLLFRAASNTGVDVVTLGGSLVPIIPLSIGAIADETADVGFGRESSGQAKEYSDRGQVHPRR